MAFSTSKKPSTGTLFVTFIVLFILAVSALVLSGNFASIATPFAPLLKPFASSNQPKITEHFTDAFKTDTINTEKWIVNKSGNTQVVQTAANNLRIDIPEGSVDGKAKGGNLTFKEKFKENGDFRVVAVLYRPVVTGEGVGATGIRFASAGSADDEGAVIRWQVKGATSKVVFAVTAADGTKLESQADDLPTNIAVLRLERINKKYRAYYKVGRDVSGDVAWKQLGQEQHSTLGNEGRVILFTHNTGGDAKFPKVVGRFDTVNIGWEGEPATDIRFSDAFANGVLGKQWRVKGTTGATARETQADNLVFTVPAGAVSGKPGYMRATRKSPTVGSDKDFAFQTVMFKPTITGEGRGAAGISFNSATSVDDEAAQVKWVVEGTMSKLVFVVRNPDGTLAERAEASVTQNKLTVRLARRNDKYTASYRVGDSDSDFVRIGNEESAVFGANGFVGLFANNLGVGGKYPRVTARFDSVSGSVEK